MNYEIKHVHPLSVLINALRIFVIVGFVIALFTFFMPNSAMRYSSFAQKLGAVGIFTGVYTLVFSAIASLISVLYNLWVTRFRGIRIRLEQSPD